MINVFCTVDDFFKGQQLCHQGPNSKLSDSEVLTTEIVVEFLGMDTDKGLYTYFRRNYNDWFPVLQHIHRTTFIRQAANPWAFKARLRQHLLKGIRFDPELSLIDNFPVPVYRFARAYRCWRLADKTALGHDEVAKQILLRFASSPAGMLTRGHRWYEFGPS